MKTDRQVLEEAIELIDNPEHWTQGTYALDQQGVQVNPKDEQAESWCAMGALRRVTDLYDQRYRIALAIVGRSFHSRLIEFNDSHSYDEVMLALKRGLDNLE